MIASSPPSWLASCQWTPLARWLAVLAGLGSVAALRASLWPLWPTSTPLPEARITRVLKQSGLAVEQLPLTPPQADPRRDHDKALSQTLAYRFADGAELRLVRGVARNPLEFEPKTFTLKRKDLYLKTPQVLKGPPAQRTGTITGRPALQTCLVAQSPAATGYGVEWKPLGELVNRSAVGRASAVRRFVGLEANRTYSCVLITLRSGGPQPVSPMLWSRILEVLPQAMRPGEASDSAAPATGSGS